MIEEIIQREWDFFQQVNNIEGRASCQDDFETFYLQRKAQFQVFSNQMLAAYLDDLKIAEKEGRNMVYEKYAYMMESTDPEYFGTIKDSLPPVDPDMKEVIDAVCRIEVGMREEFNEKYPKLAGNSRHTHSDEDKKYNTSFETYLRGELCTYSSYTLYLYAQMVVDMSKNGENIIIETMKHTVENYGYASLEEAESKA